MASLLNAQERTISLIQYQRSTTTSSKMLLAFVRERTSCSEVSLEEGWVVRCECAVPIPLSGDTNAGDTRLPRAIGVTVQYLDGAVLLQGEAPFPIRLQTDDEDMDDARYTSWKSHWIATFPERYSEMLINPLETSTR